MTTPLTPGYQLEIYDPVDGTVSLGPVVPDLPTAPHGLVAARVDADAVPDLAIAGPSGLLIINGDTQAPIVSIPGLAPASSLAVGDFDGRTLADLAVANAQGHVTMAFQQSDGGFATDAGFDVTDAGLVLASGRVFVGRPTNLVATDGAHVWVYTYPGAPGMTFKRVDLQSPCTASDLAVADVDGDGSPDVIVVCSDLSTVQFASFSSLDGGSWSWGVSATNPSSSVAVGDINRDGAKDLILAEGAAGVEVLWGPLQNGGVSSQMFPNIPADFVSLAGPSDAPINGIVALRATPAPDQLSTWRVAGSAADGGLLGRSLGIAADAMAVADFFRTGRNTLAVAQPYQGSEFLTVYFNDGGSLDGGFWPGSFSSAVAADLNGDGLPDVGLASNDNVASATAPGFRLAASGTYSPGPSAIAAGDLNQDGMDDLVHIDFASGRVYTSTGPFLAPIYGTPAALAVADVNRDGFPDLLVAERDAGFGPKLDLEPYPAFNGQNALALACDPVAVATGELLTNGADDVVNAAVACGDGTIELIREFGGAVYVQATLPSAGLSGVNSLVMADIDGDGRHRR